MNPATFEQKQAIVKVLNGAELDPAVGARFLSSLIFDMS